MLFNKGIKNRFSIDRSTHITLTQEEDSELRILQVLQKESMLQFNVPYFLSINLLTESPVCSVIEGALSH